MAKLILDRVYKSYDNEQYAVKDFSLEVDDNEFIVLVGPSGCGKSSVLRMIAGLEEITSGKLFIDDELCNGVKPKDRDIAMIFQDYALYPHLSIYENLGFGLKLRKYSKDEIDIKVKSTAKMLGLTDLLERKPKALSGGEKQRVAMGRAMVRNPNIFLMDEPLSNLDAKLRIQMRSEIKKLHKDLNATVIYVTHDQTEAMTLGTRIVVIKDGIIQQAGRPIDLYESPANMFVAEFLGTPPMNFIYREDIIIGIRPEHLLLSSKNSKDGYCAYLEYTDYLGSEMLLYCRFENRQIIIRSPDNKIYEPGFEKIYFTFDPVNAHLFSIDDGRRLE